MTQNILNEVKHRKVDLEQFKKAKVALEFEKVSDVNSVKLKAGVVLSVPLSFCSSGGQGMISSGFLYLPFVGAGVEAVRFVEPVVEEVKVNKQLIADANKLMTMPVRKV